MVPRFSRLKLDGLFYLCRNKDAQDELNTWGLNFDQQLLNLSGRVLPAERISQGPRSVGHRTGTLR